MILVHETSFNILIHFLPELSFDSQRTIHIFTTHLYQTSYGKQYSVKFLDW